MKTFLEYLPFILVAIVLVFCFFLIIKEAFDDKFHIQCVCDCEDINQETKQEPLQNETKNNIENHLKSKEKELRSKYRFKEVNNSAKQICIEEYAPRNRVHIRMSGGRSLEGPPCNKSWYCAYDFNGRDSSGGIGYQRFYSSLEEAKLALDEHIENELRRELSYINYLNSR